MRVRIQPEMVDERTTGILRFAQNDMQWALRITGNGLRMTSMGLRVTGEGLANREA